MSVNLLKFFKEVENEQYCIVKSCDLLEYKEGSDIDIFCFDLKSFSQKIIIEANNYIKDGYSIKVNSSIKYHWHIDLMKDNKIDIRFDLYGNMPNYQNILIKNALFSSIVENRISKDIKEVTVYFQSELDELIIRYLEYIENYRLRPDKIKHLDYIMHRLKENDERKFLDKLHFYTKFPEVLEVKKKNDLIMLVKEIVQKVKSTPLRELPRKFIKFVRKRVKN